MGVVLCSVVEVVVFVFVISMLIFGCDLSIEYRCLVLVRLLMIGVVCLLVSVLMKWLSVVWL